MQALLTISNFVAFSENPNFMYVINMYINTKCKHFIRSTEFDETYHNEANTGGITKIALKKLLEFFGQSR